MTTRRINHNPPPVQIPAGYLTVREVACRLHCGGNKVRKLIAKGLLATGNLPGSSRTLIRVEAFERYCRWQGEARREWRLDE